MPATYRGLVPTIGEILHEAGWKGFYRGLGVNLVRTVPNSAVTMLTCVWTELFYIRSVGDLGLTYVCFFSL